jgi:hypothetical protein
MRLTELKSVPAEKILSYIKSIQGDGHFYMDHLVTRHPLWRLTRIPLSKLKINPDPETENPLGSNINVQDIDHKPIVVDSSGWIIDGNHRATAAQQQGLSSIPAYIPA